MAALTVPAAGQFIEHSEVIHQWRGENVGDQFGWVGNPVGDLDGDGVNDLVLTAPTRGKNNHGAIYVYSGAAGAGHELWRAVGDRDFAFLGHDANAAGDMNGDGVPDVIAGAPPGGAGLFSGPGRAIVYSGADGAIIHTFTGEFPGDRFGYRVGGGGDFDGDGMTDLIVGAFRHSSVGQLFGRAYIYSGADFSLITTIDGFAPFNVLGSGVSFLGDVNGDGRDDALIGGFLAGPTFTGQAWVFSWDGGQANLLYTLDPGQPASGFGLWFMNGGDVTGDGIDDIYVNDFQANRAHLFDGTDGSLIRTLNGENEGGFGIGRMIDDVNGDGHADQVLAAWISPQGAPNGGKTFVYSGADGTVLETFTHTLPNSGFGFDAAPMGDVNGDGRMDYLITAASAESSIGISYVLAGRSPRPDVPGDLNGDGVANAFDVLMVNMNFGPCSIAPDGCPADLDDNGVIDAADMVLLLSILDPAD
jgi:hypothetical protein